MPRTAILFLIGLFFGGGLGFVVAAGNGITLDGHDHGDHAGHDMAVHSGHDMGDHHALLDVSAEGVAPAVALTLHPDIPGAVNVEITADNFRFAPESVNGPHVPGEGHAHVYVDGVKFARAYSPWMQVTGLTGGEEIRVTLNANSHEELALGEAPIDATATVPEF